MVRDGSKVGESGRAGCAGSDCQDPADVPGPVGLTCCCAQATEQDVSW